MRHRSNYSRSRKWAPAFTLIELLVVISIIALLLAILAPALRRAKEMARSLKCQTNMKGLVRAWHTYAAEHDDNIPGSFTYEITLGDPWDWTWAPWEIGGSSPIHYTGSAETFKATLEERYEGIRRGALFPYVDSIEAYHCPSDKSGNFRTYSMPDSLNGNWGRYVGGNAKGNWKNILHLSEISSPGSRYVFLEENDPRGFNRHSWVINKGGVDQVEAWFDPMVVWHSSHSNMAFADGHTEEWKWSRETFKYFAHYQEYEGYYAPTTREGIEDLQRVLDGWPR